MRLFGVVHCLLVVVVGLSCGRGWLMFCFPCVGMVGKIGECGGCVGAVNALEL